MPHRKKRSEFINIPDVFFGGPTTRHFLRAGRGIRGLSVTDRYGVRSSGAGHLSYPSRTRRKRPKRADASSVSGAKRPCTQIRGMRCFEGDQKDSSGSSVLSLKRRIFARRESERIFRDAGASLNRGRVTTLSLRERMSRSSARRDRCARALSFGTRHWDPLVMNS